MPIFQAEVPGRVRAGLEFRVGTADEPLHMAGVTHLIEHLALFGLGEKPYEYNGFTAYARTGFVMSGTPEQAIEFFGHVCAALQRLPLERVPTERRIIETEAAGHVQSSIRGSLSLRFGASGFGTADYRQIGLLWLTPQAVQEWAARHFTLGNVAAWIAGPVIPGLKIDLPPGPRMPPPPLTPKRLVLPCVAEEPGLGAVASMVAPRSTALWVGLQVLERRAMQRVRYQEGLSYNVGAAIEHLDGQTVHAFATTDALPEHVTRAASALLDVADIVSLTGPDASEIQQVAQRVDEALSDPQSAMGDLQARVQDELLGAPPRTLPQTRDEVAALTPTAVAAALKQALDSLILVMPPGAKSPRPHYAPYPFLQARPLPGTEVGHFYVPGERMIVGPSGISHCDADRRALNIAWQDVVVAARWQDGSRLLIGADGTQVLFSPPVWRDPRMILAAIDTSTPAARTVEADTPSPSQDLPPPPRIRRQGSPLAGRSSMLLVVAGVILMGVAAVAYVAMTGHH